MLKEANMSFADFDFWSKWKFLKKKMKWWTKLRKLFQAPDISKVSVGKEKTANTRFL